MELIMYTANCAGDTLNCRYPNRVVVQNPADLVRAGKRDQVFAKYKDNYRSNDNFMEAFSLMRMSRPMRLLKRIS